MDVHPIPQNVTSFQFKLVGDMTLKQFMYLAGGLGIAYFLFVLFAHDYPLVWPFIIVIALLGIGFAFLPIESRPLDHWLAAFLKAVYSPTKRVWKKNGQTYKEDPLFGSRLVMFMSALQPQSPPLPASPAPAASETFTAKPEPIAQNSGALPAEAVQTASAATLHTREELGKTVDLARQAQQLQMKIIQSERTLSHIKEQADKPTSIPVDYTQEVNKILADLQNLINQASTVKQQIQKVGEDHQQKPPAPTPQPVIKEKVKVVIPIKPKRTTIALTTFPNVINGIVKDAQNNYLEGAVSVIFDKEGLPVRALKTNKLGQFTGSTPLPNGTYTLELEKDNFRFDVLQIELAGDILPPLQITAK